MLEELEKMGFVKAQLLSLGSVLILLSLVAKFAAMRGTKRKPFPPIVDKLLRLTFFLSLVMPTFVAAPKTRVVITLLSAFYLPFYLNGSEKTGGPVLKRRRPNIVQKWFKRQLNLELVKTVELDPKGQYFFGLHPHGILPFGGIMNMCTEVSKFGEKFPGVDLRALAASFCFYVPLYREFCMGMGLRDASRYSARQLFVEGKSVLLVPGGATEALYAFPGTNILVMKRRQGFIKLALEQGVSLVPVFSFGETDSFKQFSTEYKLVRVLKHGFQYISGLSLPLLKNIFPNKCQVTTVVGKPIPVPRIDNPTDAQVNELMAVYIKAVTELYNEYRPKYQPNAKDIEFI